VTEACFEVRLSSPLLSPTCFQRCVPSTAIVSTPPVFHLRPSLASSSQFGLVDLLALTASSLGTSDLRRMFSAAAFVSSPGVVLLDEVHVNANELRLGFSNTTRNPEGILSHNNRKS